MTAVKIPLKVKKDFLIRGKMKAIWEMFAFESQIDMKIIAKLRLSLNLATVGLGFY